MRFEIHDYALNISILDVLVACLCVAVVIISVISIIRIIQRAGFSGWWILIMFFPVLNIVALWYFGFRRWPIERRAR